MMGRANPAIDTVLQRWGCRFGVDDEGALDIYPDTSRACYSTVNLVGGSHGPWPLPARVVVKDGIVMLANGGSHVGIDGCK